MKYLVLTEGVPPGEAMNYRLAEEEFDRRTRQFPDMVITLACIFEQTESRKAVVTQPDPEADEAPHWLFREHFNGDGEVL